MLRISLRSVLSHKVRLALTATAVVLGVAFASGMLMLTNALDRTFLDIFSGSSQDVIVTPKPAVDAQFAGQRGDDALLLLGQDVVDRISGLDGVAAAAGGITANGAYLVDAQGEFVGAVGPPALAVDWTPQDELRPTTLLSGRAPAGPDEVAVDEATFPKLGVALGGTVKVLTPKGELLATVVGTFKFGDTGGLAGATVTAFAPATAQEQFAAAGQWQSVAVATADGFSDDEVAASIRQALGDGYAVQTREQQVEASAGALREGLAFVNYILLGFAGISLFVAAFLIYNTFTMLVAARGKEMALLRAVGATRRQVLGSVLLEALLLGLLAAAVGVALGYGLALLMKVGVGAAGLALDAAITPTAQSIGVALLLGVSVTVVAAVAPALRASRIRPVEALRQAATPPDRPSLPITLLGVGALAVAAVLVAPALVVDEPDVARTAIGALVLLLAGILLAPVLAMAYARVMTPLLRRAAGVPGRLAGRNAGRSPRRIAATASALIVGLALVTGVTVVVASAQRSIEQLVDSSFGAELMINAPALMPFSTTIGDQIAEVDGVRYVIRDSAGGASLDGRPVTVSAIGGGPIDAVFTVQTTQGDLAAFGPGRTVVGADFAADYGIALGDSVNLLFASGQELTLQVAGLFEPNTLLSGMVIAMDDYRGVGGAAQDTLLYVDLEPDADPAQVVPQIEAITDVNPLLQVADQTAVKEQNTQALNQLLYLIYAMLGLSIIIAALGVVNTMVLSVLERTREIGMLRAVGAARRDVRRMIRWEAVLVSSLGGIVGVALGVVAAVCLQRALAPSGIAELVIPGTTIAVLLIAAVLIGVLGATFPARRAARLDILRAIATE